MAWNARCHLVFFLGLYCVSAQPTRTQWGNEFPSSECAKVSKRALLPDILDGKMEPYAFNGPPEACQNHGCRHLYWGERCRWTKTFPACPQETKDSLTRLLKQHAYSGADWAKDVLSLQPCEVFEVVKGRTLWYIGDSITQETVLAIICVLLEYHESFEAPPISDDADLMHRLYHNANDQKLATFCHQLVENTRICMLRANFGPRMASVMLPALAKLTKEEDIVVMNFGLWSNNLEELELHSSMFKASFQFHKNQLPKRTFWRQTSAQHYRTPSGMYDSDAPIQQQRCTPSFPGVNITLDTGGRLIPMPGMPLPEQWSPEDWELNVVLKGGHRNQVTQGIIDGLGMYTIPVWNTSMVLWSFHHHLHDPSEDKPCATIDCDCTHACQPSWSQVWLPEFLHAFENPNLWLKRGDNATAA